MGQNTDYQFCIFHITKVATFTFIGTALPCFKGLDGAIDAFGTALIWTEASMLIGSVDMIIENIMEQKRAEDSKLSNRSLLYHNMNAAMAIP